MYFDNGSNYTSVSYDILNDTLVYYNIEQPDQAGYAITPLSIAGEKILYNSPVGLYVADYNGFNLTDVTNLVTDAGGAVGGRWKWRMFYSEDTYFLCGEETFTGGLAYIINMETGSFYTRLAYSFSVGPVPVVYYDESINETRAHIPGGGGSGENTWFASLNIGDMTAFSETTFPSRLYSIYYGGLGVSQNGKYFDGQSTVRDFAAVTSYNLGDRYLARDVAGIWLISEWDY